MMRLLKLKIEAFRGIPGALELDLSHPINLIYAPNGTGKTSVCDAIEWLLTGQIKRLGISSSSEANELRCALSNIDDDTKVWGTFNIDGKKLLLERSLDRIQWARGDDKLGAVSLSNLLEVLAPSAVDPESHARHANSSRQIWLRGTRFLSAESLAALLDSDDSSLENRQRLFSDLLGVGHLLEAERLLENYGKQINQSIQQRQEKIDDKASSINARREKLNQDAPKDEQAAGAAALESIRAARTILRLSEIAPSRLLELSDLRRLALETGGVIEQRKNEWTRKQQAEIALSQNWPDRNLIEQQHKEASNRLQQVSALIVEKTALLDSAEKELSNSERNLAEYRTKIPQCLDRLQRLSGAAAYAQTYALQYDARSDRGTLTVQDALLIAEAEGSESLRSKRSSVLKDLTAEISERVQERQELSTARLQAAKLSPNLKTEEQLKLLREGLAEARADAESKRGGYDLVAGPVQQLQLLSSSILELLGHDRNCPVCKHNWGTSDALRRAIQDAIKLTPESVIHLEKEAQEADARVKSLSATLASHAENQKEFDALTRRIKALNTSQASYVARLAEVGLSAESKTLQTDIELALIRLSLVDGVQRFREELVPTQQLLGVSVALNVSFLEFSKVIGDAGRKAIDQLNADYIAAGGAHKPLLDRRDGIKIELQTLEADQLSMRTRVAGDAKRLSDLKEAWQTLAGVTPWTDEMFERVTVDLRSSYDELSRAQQYAEQSNRAIERSTQHTEIIQLEDELQPLLAERNRLTKLSEAAHKAKLAYDERLQTHVRSQMEEIVKVISALFLRMQANEVYDRIVGGDDSKPLSWRAICNGTPLDPEKKFSQGQRQDFALAIFLARARGLRGSFFMDEPLAHLDDLNRVALLDVFRAIALEGDSQLSFILTTASRAVARHFLEKFWRIDRAMEMGAPPLLNTIELIGNPRVGVRQVQYTN